MSGYRGNPDWRDMRSSSWRHAFPAAVTEDVPLDGRRLVRSEPSFGSTSRTYARRAWSIASRTSVAAARNCVITASANASDNGMTS